MTGDLLSGIAPAVRGMLGPGAAEVFRVGDHFSADRRFRFDLYYDWARDLPPLIVLGQNPSKASRERTDPTVIRCARRAWRAGFGGLRMLNLFPLVATDPADLWAAGPQPEEEDQNVAGIEAVVALLRAATVLIAPGGDPHPRQRAMAAKVEAILRERDARLLCLGTTATGAPRHPSRLGYDVPMVPWTGTFREHAAP
jgi:hypothetical protein